MCKMFSLIGLSLALLGGCSSESDVAQPLDTQLSQTLPNAKVAGASVTMPKVRTTTRPQAVLDDECPDKTYSGICARPGLDCNIKCKNTFTPSGKRYDGGECDEDTNDCVCSCEN